MSLQRILWSLWIVSFAVTLPAQQALAKRTQKELPKDYKVMAHIHFGLDTGFSSEDMVNKTNEIALSIIKSSDQMGDFGLGINFGLDVLYNFKGPFWLGGGLNINTASTHQYFKYYDSSDNFYNEYYSVSLTTGTVDGLAMFCFNTKGFFSPYFYGGGGISLTVMNFDNYMVNVDAMPHFYIGQATLYSPDLRAGAGIAIPLFNIGKFFTQVGYSYPSKSFSVTTMQWGVKRDVWEITFGFDRAF
jgi:hypothetical protein